MLSSVLLRMPLYPCAACGHRHPQSVGSSHGGASAEPQARPRCGCAGGGQRQWTAPVTASWWSSGPAMAWRFQLMRRLPVMS